MISLKKFIEKTQGKSIAVSWGYKGECVSLVQRYLVECYGFPEVARGDAYVYGDIVINRGEGKKTNDPKYGDLVVYDASPYTHPQYGHVAIYIDSNTIYDQNRRGDRTAKKRSCLGKAYVKQYIRLNGNRPEDEKPKPSKLKFKVGDKVIVNGNLYTSSNAASPNGTVKNKITKITRVVEGAKYPYNTTGDLGWMDEKDIKLQSTPSKSAYEIAKEILTNPNHPYGNGEAREKKLGKQYDEVMKIIDDTLYGNDMRIIKDVAEEVWKEGKYGKGEAREKRLGIIYDKVQAYIEKTYY